MAATMRIALTGLFEEVNTFAVESMGLAKITGNMTTGFQKWSGKGLIDDYKGSKTYMSGYIAALEEASGVEIVPTVLYSYSAGPTIEGSTYKEAGDPGGPEGSDASGRGRDPVSRCRRRRRRR
jgi:Metallopeptidase family M81